MPTAGKLFWTWQLLKCYQTGRSNQIALSQFVPHWHNPASQPFKAKYVLGLTHNINVFYQNVIFVGFIRLSERSYFWCDFERASSLIFWSKMPTRCNRDFYCKSYCLLNMFRVPLCPSSGAQEYYTVVVACGIWCCGFQVVGLVWSWGLCVRFAGCWFTG